MPLQVDEGGGAVLRRHIEELGVARAHRRRDHADRRPADGARRGAGVRRRQPRSTPTWSCSPPASGRATSWPAPPASRSASAAASSSTTPAAPTRPGRLRHRRVRLRRRPRATAWSPRATRWPRSSPTGCSAATATFTGADMSTKLKLLGVDVASFGDAFARDAGRARGRRTPTRSPASTRSSSLSDDAQTLLGGILVGDASRVRRAARRWSARALPARPGGAASLPAGGGAGAGWRRCPTTRRSARATTSPTGDDPRARSATRAAPTSPASRPAPGPGTGCGSCVPLRQAAARRRAASGRRRGQQRAVRALRAQPRRSCSTSCACTGITHVHAS